MARLKRFLPLIVLGAVIALIFGMGWNRYLSLDTIRDHGAEFRAFTADNYILSLLILFATVLWSYVGISQLRGESLSPPFLAVYILFYAPLITFFWLVTAFKEVTRSKLRW